MRARSASGSFGQRSVADGATSGRVAQGAHLLFPTHTRALARAHRKRTSTYAPHATARPRVSCLGLGVIPHLVDGEGFFGGETQAMASADAPRGLVGGKPAFVEDDSQRLFAGRAFAVVGAPALPRQIEIGGGSAMRLAGFAAFGEPAAGCVLGVEVGFGSVAHDGRRVEAALVPIQAALEGPGQDTIPLGEQLGLEVFVALSLGDDDGEGDQMYSGADRRVDAAQVELVVARNDKLALRHVGEK